MKNETWNVGRAIGLKQNQPEVKPIRNVAEYCELFWSLGKSEQGADLVSPKSTLRFEGFR